MNKARVLPVDDLRRFLDRKRSIHLFQTYISFDAFLLQVIEMANRFVASEAVSILLDDPQTKGTDATKNRLYFVASSGESAEQILGKSIHGDMGVAGYVYTRDEPYGTNTPYDDPHFDPTWDRENGFVTRSIIAAPIHIEKAVCGILEMVNAVSDEGFTYKEFNLLKVFADYTSLSIQNVLDARRAQEMAQRDELTGLYNDRYFHMQLGKDIDATEDKSNLVLLFLDLDKFKAVNDTYGHLAGSQTLREVGYLLKDVVDWQGATLARYGGDEFVIILPEALVSQAREISAKIIKTIEENTFLAHTFGFNQGPLNLKHLISCSIGISSLRECREQAPASGNQIKDELIRQADHAMYQAKERGHGLIQVASTTP